MAWLHLTIGPNDKRHVNLDRFVFIKADKGGSYLICMEPANSVRVEESPEAIDKLLKAARGGGLFGRG